LARFASTTILKFNFSHLTAHGKIQLKRAVFYVIFLMMERPFSIGDVIRVDSTTGEVISIDLLSVKLRTFDNLFVRIPNESMIKTQVTTLTKFPIRRADMPIGIAYKEDIERVKSILNDLADKNILCLTEPAPLFIVLGFGTSSVDIQFSVFGLCHKTHTGGDKWI
jgi:small-conductance mechanosensitive channel